MKKESGSTPAGRGDPLAAWSRSLPPDFRATCDRLRELIDAALPKATAKVWHGSPVWFLGEHPVVGYSANAKRVQLLFWNGQAFDEPGLRPMGSFRAAEAVYAKAGEVDAVLVRRWLRKAGKDVLDSAALARQRRECG